MDPGSCTLSLKWYPMDLGSHNLFLWDPLDLGSYIQAMSRDPGSCQACLPSDLVDLGSCFFCHDTSLVASIGGSSQLKLKCVFGQDLFYAKWDELGVSS